jgi:hypothetical protein
MGLGRPLQRLEHSPVPLVGGRLIDASLPDGVARHVVDAGEHVARELMGEEEDALGRQIASVLVHGGEGGHHGIHQRDLGVHERSPVRPRRRNSPFGYLNSARHGVHQLPQERRPVVGVAGEELVEQGGARTTEAGHDDRALDLLLSDGRLALPQVDQAKTVLQDELELGPSPQAAGEVELGLVVERRAQPLERIEEPGVTAVVEACGRSRRVEEIVGLERDDRQPIVAQAAPVGDDVLDPRCSCRRGPLHRREGTPRKTHSREDGGVGPARAHGKV